ncbi:MAG: RNA-directed DNA polymerase [Candidatus Krumholzibacteria bacterium]|nr:RNA-directed DNA polymerase [Candidatus Krumholzibacteria bacterium]
MLAELHDNFEENMSSFPPDIIETLSQVGYTGFRWAAQIEPFWNAYYLACVLRLADDIESVRLPEDAQTVFSYRFDWQEDTGKLFKDSTWRDYKTRCIDLSREYPVVLVSDIADFYPRIYHHRVNNALSRLPNAAEMRGRIMSLLSAFSMINVSYGLPIGGPASRILAELALAGVDQHLRTRKLTFCRYADDFCIFCADKSTAYKALVFLSEQLFNEGLVLQKKKTRILSAEEYRETSKAFMPTDDEEGTSDEKKLLNISLRFDPYSPTAEEDYETLKAAVGDVDILGILGREVAKTAIDPTVSKQAINAIKALEPPLQGAAVRTVLDPKNLDVLSPVFVTILRLVRSVYGALLDGDKDFVDNALMTLHQQASPLLSVELNLSYYIQVLGQRKSQPKEELLVQLFESHHNPLLRRLILLILADWECHYWLSDLKRRYAGLSSWERRAFILASYVLGDEGNHWRKHAKRSWSPMDTLVRDWFSTRFPKNSRLPI